MEISKEMLIRELEKNNKCKKVLIGVSLAMPLIASAVLVLTAI